jgi:hypothetical protein
MRDKLLINNYAVDVFEETSYSITSSIIDIREPDKRKTDFSKTITIPATKNNNLIFSNAFQLDKEIISTNNLENYSPEFNPSLKATATLFIDELPILIGSVQLMNIIIEEGKMTYEIVLFGQFSNIYYKWKDLQLNELDFSSFDHALTVANQQASWSPTLGVGYVYPPIDYGFNNSANTVWNVIDMYPAFFVKQYIDKMFAYAGFTYTSAFFNTTFFKSLIVPFNRKSFNLTNAQILEREFDVFFSKLINVISLVNSPAYSDFTSSVVQNVSYMNNDVDDVNKGWESNNKFVVKSGGVYDISAFISDMSVTVIPNATVDTFNGTFAVITRLYHYDSSSNTTTLLDSDTQSITALLTIPFSGSQTTALFTSTLSEIGISLDINDEIYITCDLAVSNDFEFLDGGANQVVFDAFIQTFGNVADYFTVRAGNAIVNEGDTVICNNIIPDKIKVTDFFNSIVKMFNLYVDIDKDDENNLIIKPVNNYYTNNVVDWTNKVDVSKGISIQPMAEVSAKTYKWSYKADKDYYNTLYSEQNNGNIYGNKIIELNNDFVTGEQDTQVIFSPTPLVGTATNNICTPAIYALDKQGNKERMDSNIRLLYWGGYKALNTTFYHVSTIGDSTSYTDFYPFSAHIDDVLNPTIDINFDLTTQLFYPTNIVTNNNVFNAFHRAFFNEISSIDSKLVTLYVKITPLDKLNLSFADLYFIDNNYYRLHKVIDYDCIKYGYTKCEFLKIKATNPFISVQRPVKPAVTNIDILQGGVDEVRSLSATSFYNLVQGGQDETRDIGATSFINLFQGGQNTV